MNNAHIATSSSADDPAASASLDLFASPPGEPKLSKTDERQRNQYLREFVPAMIGYGLVLAAVLAFVDSGSSRAKFWYLLPVLPLVAVMVAVYRSLQRADEYSQLLQLKAMALGFAAAIVTSLVFGFLGVAGVSTTYAGFVVFGVAMGTWGLALGLSGVDED